MGKMPTMGVLPLPKGVLPHGVCQNAHLTFCISAFPQQKLINRECNIMVVYSAM